MKLEDLQSVEGNLPTKFLEEPLINLLLVDYASMTDVERDLLLAELKEHTQIPGKLKRRLTEESTEIKTKTPRKSKAKYDIGGVV